MQLWRGALLRVSATLRQGWIFWIAISAIRER
jgi:hypothetical protein